MQFPMLTTASTPPFGQDLYDHATTTLRTKARWFEIARDLTLEVIT